MYFIFLGDQVKILYGNEKWAKVSAEGMSDGYVLQFGLIQGKFKLDLSFGVNLKEVLNNPIVNLTYASTVNICKFMLIPNIAILEAETTNRLAKAEEKFNGAGYRLKIYEAYSPESAQKAIWSKAGNAEYIEDPSDGPNNHTQGRAVDISLVDIETGEELEMPTKIYTFDETSKRVSTASWTEEQEKT